MDLAQRHAGLYGSIWCNFHTSTHGLLASVIDVILLTAFSPKVTLL